MKAFFRGVWRIVSFPFVAVFFLVRLPLRLIHNFIEFLNTEPEERPVAESLAIVVSDDDARRSLWKQIDDLRSHLIRMLVGLSIAVVGSFWFTLPLMEYLAGPVKGLASLQAIEVTEEIGVFMRVALTSGITIALPYIAFEIWWFAAPGLKPRERKFSLVGIPLAGLLFALGVVFTFYILIPAALPFLGGFTNISQFWTAKEYFGFITGLMVWIGIFFEFPLIVYMLTSIGLLQPRMLARQWRLAIVIIAILAAAVTPTVDPVNMGLVMFPMILLYFISIGLSHIAYAGRRGNRSATETPVGENQTQTG